MRTLPLFVCATLICASPSAVDAQRVEVVAPTDGMVITHSVRLKPGVWHLHPGRVPDSAAITVRGTGVTVEMSGVTLMGADSSMPPDSAFGTAIRVDGGARVRVSHGRIRGFKVALLARHTSDLSIDDVDASDNWRPRLYSETGHESLVDWLDFHNNERDEWLRYGAAFYLSDVHRGEIRGDVVRHGMNALMMVRSDSLLVMGNDFSFDSGLGVGLYRSSDNRIVHNRVDFDVRGYSEGYYHRGQDSADLLLYEQSDRNVIAYNSATHGGDGFFLWAGQSTMDSGAGGANDNLVYGNDFSFSPANGIEATFSRNTFAANTVEGSDYGVWAGYSFDSRFVGNHFAHNRNGIAIEHGQANAIVGNWFDGDTTAISLWAAPVTDTSWGYAKRRDVSSRDYAIDGNIIDGSRVALRVAQSRDVKFARNTLAGVDSAIVDRDSSEVLASDTKRGARGSGMATITPTWVMDSLMKLAPKRMGGGLAPDMATARMPRSAIIVDEWGPYDYRTPKMWLLDSLPALRVRIAVLGPKGAWRLSDSHGVTLSRTTGIVPDTITATLAAPNDEWWVKATYSGATTTTFGYGHYEPAITWKARAFAWNDSAMAQVTPERFDSMATHFALLDTTMSRLDFIWYRPVLRALPVEKWALGATGEVNVPATGSYKLQTISDDGVRVWIDDALAIDDWTPHESDVREVPIAPGHHVLRVQYCQVDGWSELRVVMVRR